MDPVTSLGLVVSAIEVWQRTISILLDVGLSGVESTASTHGWLVAFFTIFPLLQVSKADSRSAQKLILDGSDEEALTFRQSVTHECNMTAVAGAIVAQIAITSLSLPKLSQAHWVARAFLLFALVSGLLSVFFECVLRRIIGRLYGPAQIRQWLTVSIKKEQKIGEPDVSFATLSMVSAPFKMVEYSIFSLLIALAVYQGFVWTRSLDTDAGEMGSRNVFIAYVAGTGYCVEFFAATSVLKTVETVIYRLKKRRRNHDIRSGEDFNDDPAGVEMGAVSHDNPPQPSQQQPNGPDPRHHPGKTQTAGLKAALQAAAHAREQCAKADLQVALEYNKASASLQP